MKEVVVVSTARTAIAFGGSVRDKTAFMETSPVPPTQAALGKTGLANEAFAAPAPAVIREPRRDSERVLERV